MGGITSGRKCEIKDVCSPVPTSNCVAPAKCLFSIFSSGAVHQLQVVYYMRPRPCKEADARSLFILVACRERKYYSQFCDFRRKWSRNDCGLHVKSCLRFRSQSCRSRFDVGMEYGMDLVGEVKRGIEVALVKPHRHLIFIAPSTDTTTKGGKVGKVTNALNVTRLRHSQTIHERVR